MTTNAVAAPSAPKPSIKAGGSIAALVPQDADQAFRLANALANAGDMIPKQFQGKPNDIMAAIARGMEIGLAPMQALSSIAVINGRAALFGDAIPALMQRAGHHLDVEYEGQEDTLVAVATLTRGDNGRVIIRRFSMADAKRAGLLNKQGPWTQYTSRMLAMRARTWACRDGAADALMGLHVAEEVQDYGPDRARDVTPKAPRRGGVVYHDEPAAPQIDHIVEHDADGVVIDGPTPDEIAARLAEAEAAARESSREAEDE